MRQRRRGSGRGTPPGKILRTAATCCPVLALALIVAACDDADEVAGSGGSGYDDPDATLVEPATAAEEIAADDELTGTR